MPDTLNAGPAVWVEPMPPRIEPAALIADRAARRSDGVLAVIVDRALIDRLTALSRRLDDKVDEVDAIGNGKPDHTDWRRIRDIAAELRGCLAIAGPVCSAKEPPA